MEYLSVVELAKKSGIPRTTVRRWINEFDGFFTSEIKDDRVVYASRTVRQLCWIERLRAQGMSMMEIKSIWIRSLILVAIEDEDTIRRLDKKNVEFIAEIARLRRSVDAWAEKCNDMAYKVYNTNLWQRIFKKWYAPTSDS